MSKTNIRQMTLISLFAALTAVGAFISVPIYPVPLTLQTLFTLLAAMTRRASHNEIGTQSSEPRQKF